MNDNVQNPNDFKVVSFHNLTDFGFTPEMGCMYDSRPILGRNGLPGIAPGETIVLPYHVAQQLATNLAKRVLNTSPAATVDEKGVPTGVAVWDKDLLEQKKNEFLKELYTEANPVTESQTDLLMRKVEEYRGLVEQLLQDRDAKVPETEEEQLVANAVQPLVTNSTEAPVYADKQEVIAELEKRGIVHDKRKNKAELEKLLV